ncbi:MAG TPA: PLP-dependent aspartate aminotransferase family protein [Mangrovimonas sp.]|nr:PLP-dependent aspartate aminotransferase family protein [Mangrovimonas sp.]
MKTKKLGLNTVCVHTGEVEDLTFKGAISPIYLSTSYEFDEVDALRYPRNFNTPNQEALCAKIAALEHTEAALLFGSGMAALSAVFMAFLKSGDHLVVQNTLYGGAVNFIRQEFPKFGIEYTFTEGYEVDDFAAAIKPNTKLIHIETPSNPLLTITDIQGVANLAKSRGILTVIDNTFASPVNQNPIDFGIDIVMHSATKYMGGHSDILAGALAASHQYIDIIKDSAKNFGGNLSDFTVWMLERSMKTMGIRVKAQNRNAKKMAKWLSNQELVTQVNYPGLKSHPQYELAKTQMKGSGGMLSFELKPEVDPLKFMHALKYIKPVGSLAGVESTILLPAKTSHALLTPDQRATMGVSDRLIRFSVGIESKDDLMDDISQALEKALLNLELQKQ